MRVHSMRGQSFPSQGTGDTLGDSTVSVKALRHAAWSCLFSSIVVHGVLWSRGLKPSWLSTLLRSEGEHRDVSFLSRNRFDLCLYLQASEVQDGGKARGDLDLTLGGQFCHEQEVDRTGRSPHVPLKLRNQI